MKSNVVEIQKWKQAKASSMNGSDTGVEMPEDTEMVDRIANIKNSLARINMLMAELRTMSFDNSKPTTPDVVVPEN